MSSQEGGVKGLVGPDLSKVQGENEFFTFAVLLNFFAFFQKKFWLMSNMQMLKVFD